VSDGYRIGLETIASDDWRRLRKLRLFALRESPEAFLASYHQEKAHPKDWWLAELARGRWHVAVPGRKLIRFFRRKPISFLGVTHKPDTAAHMRCIEYLWVAPQKRRSGIGLDFISLIVSRLRSEGIRTVVLAVLDGNQAAMNLYLKAGFTLDGEPVPLETRPGRTEQFLRMELPDPDVSGARQPRTPTAG
jgi:RimJ/RimL family protein N-acetyltransferase